ncbi:RELT-like protein 2 [Larimichthys crocea]|uniref:RELT-like protein 2 n=1 Tax=Larimichthys crocea TaxID=215358 RepID=A0A0F8B0N6_LARCR|nr:nascent polypeptide-associated complex subunit alpha, muscle-specific form [Larimichthys crocea]XP_010748942.2 nascent polypeptide-associated complex subunit alpha, muscle-specific form [Larimichthys crocea]XP_019126603.1 nascent polypeptide-associated complex subunit alpha, muscle-specific form [Larimichthys crocea]XP_019126605.1 nascent polypeptide-associated complex subunit alpha, muscle-specific form [Larimichthys crocea]XP_027135674.1 nascent polypeptide-associated complex subunit alpha
MTELEATVGEPPPPYMIFVVVFLFFLTGLFGFLICHLLKKKGYRCRTGDMDDEEEGEKLGGNADDDDEEHQDTVEQILKCIIENEANMEAFNEMLGNQKVCVRHDPRLRKESIGGIPPHHHTVHSGADHNSCHLCAQGRSKKGRRQSRTPRSKQRPGEQTVFSVGRFRVTHNDKKPQGGPNPLVSSGDQLDQSQDSEERKESGYNLRSMFKDVRPPSENSNGVVPNVGKRRKSLTIFGLRRGSDPVGIKVGEGVGRETGGIKFAIKQQPVVLEELQSENVEVTPELDIKPESEPQKNQISASPKRDAKTQGSVNSPSSQNKIQTRGLSPAPEDGFKRDPSPEPCINLKPSRSTAASVPSSLPIPSPASSGQTFKTSEKEGEDEDQVLKMKDAYDPGPLQTSTPIAPMHGSIPGFIPVIPTGQLEPYSSTSFPVTQTPPDPSSSQAMEPGFGSSLVLISLGSSPPSSTQMKTPSSVSSLKTPTSPLVVTPSPKLSSRNTPSEATKPDFSPALTPSPKFQSGRKMSSQSPIPSSSFGKSTSPLQIRTPSPALTARPKLDTMSPQTPSSPADQNPSLGTSPRLILKSGSMTPVTSMTQGDMVSNLLSLKEQELEGVPKIEEKTEIKRVGILKTAYNLPTDEGDCKASTFSSPTDQLSKDRLSSLPLSSSSPLSPSSPIGSKISNVTIVKASPDSKREFSVVTMVEEGESSTSIKDRKRETSELVVKSGKAGIGPTVGQGENVSISGFGQTESQLEDTPGAENRPTVSQEKDDMMEMEDIRDCKVTQVEEAERADEGLEKMVDKQV